MAGRLPRLLLHFEGLVLLVSAAVAYFHLDYSTLAFFLLFLAPDVSIVAYAMGPRIGALAYDVVHTTVPGVALAAIGLVSDSGLAIQLGLIWLAHIGADRALGYGLKYPSSFRDTHLQRV
jgi:hypothetical protein